MISRSLPSLLLSSAMLLALLGLPACNKSGEGGAPGTQLGATTSTSPPVTAEALKEAREIFALRCTPCHGALGRGDGAASAGLTPKPRNYQDQAWQKNVTDENIEKIILYGGAAVGKSFAMPPNPDLQSKPQVVAALRTHIRELGKL